MVDFATGGPAAGGPAPYRGLRVVTNNQLDAQQQVEDQARRQAEDSRANIQPYVGLAGYIRTQWNTMVRHRNTIAGWSDRLLQALRTFNGQYDPSKLAEIRRFGGSEVYCRLIAAKCRGASSLLRDVYLGADRPWGLTPPDDPPIDPQILQHIQDLVKTEVMTLMEAGQPPTADKLKERTLQLLKAARDAAKVKAKDQTEIAEDKVDELLTEGGFYKALAEFLTDIPLFPLACIKGPTVRMVTQVQWAGNRPVQRAIPKLWWERVSPFDIWITPGVADIEDAQIVERFRITRTDLNDLLDLPGYNTENIRYILEFYGTQGVTDDWDTTDASRAVMESRENPVMNESHMLTGLMFTGNVQGRLLLDQAGFDPADVPDPLRDYSIQAWLIGNYLIKVQLNPSPRRRHNYYVTSWEKVPGTPIGNGLPDIISDLQEVMNATLRSLVNNMCLTGDTVVYKHPRKVNPVKRRRPAEQVEMTLRQVVDQDGRGLPGNNGGRKPLWLRAMDETTGEIIANKVVGVHRNGVQDVWRITTAKGYSIKATTTHRFYVEGKGWVRVAGLSVGQMLGVNGAWACVDCGVPLSRPDAKRCRKHASSGLIAGSWNNHQAVEALVNDKVTENTARGRLLVRRQRKDNCESCGSITRLEVHHLDKNPLNCDPANLRTFCDVCHKAWHVRHGYFGDARRHLFVDFDAIVGIVHVGSEETFCLTMEAPNHNFIANGIVSGNSIASGPQVVINEDRMTGQDSSDELFPWKRWRVTNPTVSGTQEPAVNFFSPQSNAQELLAVFNAFYGLSDDISAIPKYLAGNSPGGGAGRTASGLAMLMGNASKLLQTVCANIDRDVMGPNLQNTLDMILLTDQSGLLTGEEEVVPKGVVVAMQKETMRARQMEFLQITANPIDMQIIGPKGRATVLRSVSQTIGLDGEEIVPSREQLEQQQQTAQDQAAAQGVPGHAQGPPQPPGGASGAPGGGPPPPGGSPQGLRDKGPRTNVVGNPGGGPQ
jgi:hypothetical protein